MQHRHIDPDNWTLAAIDDVVTRGRWAEWAQLRRATQAQPRLLLQIERVCRAKAYEPQAQRHAFWLHYVKKHVPAA